MTFTSEQLYKAVLELCINSADNGLESVEQFVDVLKDPEHWAQELFNEYVVIMSNQSN